ncbi:ATP-binding protein [Streptomyces sp. NPDC056500]|uniref:ATP-binding protein n=1 Tax=Streptomyces sp. NPDC056500 TaxID=3345840 RepID=UPI00368B6DCF
MQPSTVLRSPSDRLSSGSRRLRLAVPNTRTAARAARHWLAAVLRGSPHPQLGDDAMLCLSELVTNAHRHTSTPTIRVQALIAVEFVVVRVRDNHPEPLPPAPEAGCPGGEGECGRGLALVEACADAWGVTFFGGARPRGKSVWFKLLAREGPG